MWRCAYYMTISREDPRITSVDIYDEIMQSEWHHTHEIVIDNRGTLRWRADPSVEAAFDSGRLDLTGHICYLYSKGLNKNSEEYRKLYRDLGYSLRGYWEVFYWEMNNPIAGEYSYP